MPAERTDDDIGMKGENTRMATKEKHRERSRRSHKAPAFKSRDLARHEMLGGVQPIYKEHRKKYDGKGNRLI